MLRQSLYWRSVAGAWSPRAVPHGRPTEARLLVRRWEGAGRRWRSRLGDRVYFNGTARRPQGTPSAPPWPSGLFAAFHLEAHLAGIGFFGQDYLEHHPGVGRSLEEPVVSDRQGSRRGEGEGEGGGGGFVAAHPGVFYGAGRIGSDVSGEMHSLRIAVAGDDRRMIQGGLEGQCREQQGEHGLLYLEHLIHFQEFPNNGMAALFEAGDGAKINHATGIQKHYAIGYFVHQIEIVRDDHAGELQLFLEAQHEVAQVVAHD